MRVFATTTLVVVGLSLAGCNRGPADPDALHEAARAGDAERVAWIVSKGVDPDAERTTPDTEEIAGQTALMAAARAGHVDVVHALLDGGADANTRDMLSRTALHEVAEADLPNADEVFSLILDHGGDPNIADSAGITPFMLASGSGCVDCVRACLDAGGDLSLADRAGGGTPLFWATVHDRTEVVNFLIEQGAEIMTPSGDGETAVMRSAGAGGSIETMRLLLDAGAEVNTRDNQGCTAIWYAAGGGDADRVRALIEQGADVNIAADTTMTPLMRAARYGDAARVTLLAAHGADLAAVDKNGQNALHHAAAGNAATTEQVQALLDAGADIAATDENDWTALHHTASTGDDDRARILIAAGASLDATTNDGQTPLQVAQNRNPFDGAVKRRLIQVLQEAADGSGS